MFCNPDNVTCPECGCNKIKQQVGIAIYIPMECGNAKEKRLGLNTWTRNCRSTRPWTST